MSDLREALEQAVTTHEEKDAGGAQSGDSGKAPEASAATDTKQFSAGDASEQSGEAGQPGQQASTPTKPVETPTEKPTATEKQGEKQVSQDGSAQKAQQSGLKAPAYWKPEAREKWGSMDPTLQQEVVRRERETADALRKSADARKFVDGFQQIVAPYQQFFAAENATPMDGFNHYLQTAALFRVGAPQQKAQAVAQIVKQYGIDIAMLDQAIAQLYNGQQPTSGAADPAFDRLQQQFAPVIEYVNGLKQREQQLRSQSDQTLEQTIEDFASDPANEFFADVKDDVADILEMAARRGQSISLQDAYERAIMLHPTISKIVGQRKLSADLSQQNQAAQRARNAAVSVPSNGAPSHGSESQVGDSIRSAINAAVARVEAGR